MPDFRTHATFLSAEFTPTFSCFLGSHELAPNALLDKLRSAPPHLLESRLQPVFAA